MDRYLIALYTHFLAVVAAVSAASILHFNFGRVRRASTVRDAREAIGSIARVAPAMPVIALLLFATGAYLVQLRWGWQHGWVNASIVGLISMPVLSLIIQKPRLMALGKQLGAAKDGPIDDVLGAAIRSRVIWGAVLYNHVMALAIMFVMVIKPATGVAYAILALAPAAFAWTALFGKQTAKSGQPAVSTEAS